MKINDINNSIDEIYIKQNLKTFLIINNNLVFIINIYKLFIIIYTV